MPQGMTSPKDVQTCIYFYIEFSLLSPVTNLFFMILVSRAYIVKMGLSQSKISVVVLLAFHLVVHTIWYIVERKIKINIDKLKKYQINYSILNYILKGFEAALIDFFIPRCDRYRLDFLNIKHCESCVEKYRCIKKTKPFLNCLVNQVIFLLGNIAVVFWHYHLKILSFRMFLMWTSFCLGCAIFGSALTMYDLHFRILNSPVNDLIHEMRELGKIHEYFRVGDIKQFNEDVKKHNLENDTKQIMYIAEVQSDFYQIKFIGTQSQYKKALSIFEKRRRRNLTTCSEE